MNGSRFAFRGILILAVAAWLGACGDDTASNVEDPTPDAVQTDVAQEAEVATELPAETLPENPGAEATPEVIDVILVETVDETAVDVPTVDGYPLPDADWAALPRLPKDKTFTTRYAAGVARTDVTPDHNIYMGGFGFCQGAPDVCRISMGVHDPLLATAVALADTTTHEVVIFVGVDTIGIFKYDHDRMAEMIQTDLYNAYGVTFEGTRLMVSGSHAHSSPDDTGMWGPGVGEGRDEPYSKTLRDGIVAAAKEAFANLADVTLDWGQGTSLNNTDDKDHQDSDLFVLRGKDTAGATVFTMTRWPAHPTAYGSDNQGISSDWVGPFRLKMEKDLGGKAVFLQGPIGSVYPDRPSECGLAEEAYPNGFKTPATTGNKAHPALQPSDYMKVTCTGYQVAANAELAMQAPKAVAETGITFKHAEFDFHPDNGLLMMLGESVPMPIPVCDVSDPTSMYRSMLSFATIGDLTYLTTPGESFPTFGFDGKQVLLDAGYTNPIVLGLTQDWMGYLLTPAQWTDSALSYNQSLSPGPDVEPKYLDALKALVAK